MSEEEIIKQVKDDMEFGEFYGITEDAIQGLLDLYNKQKEKITSLENQLDFIGEQNKYIDKLETRLSNQEKIIEGQEEWIKDFKLKNTFKFFNEEFISKDIIRKIIKELSDQNYNNYELSVALSKSLEALLK